MGAGASTFSLPPEWDSQTPEQKADLQAKFDRMVALGKEPEQALGILLLPPKRIIKLTELMEELESSLLRGKTPLVVDNSEDTKVDTFFSYRSVSLIDGKKMGLDKSMRGVPVIDIMESARQRIVSAIKYGTPIVVALQKSVTDFRSTFNDSCLPADATEGGTRAFLPAELVFTSGGRGLLSEESMQRLFRAEDREQNLCICRDPEHFMVVVTSQFAPEDFEEYLFGTEGFGLYGTQEQYDFLIVTPEE